MKEKLKASIICKTEKLLQPAINHYSSSGLADFESLYFPTIISCCLSAVNRKKHLLISCLNRVCPGSPHQLVK